MSKTTKIIIAIAVLAAVVIAWKKGLFKAFGSDAKTTDELEKEYEADLEVTTSDPDAFNKELKQFMSRQKSLMKKIGLPADDDSYIVKLVKNIYIWCHDDDESNWTAANMVKNARNNGRTVDQQYLASALWAMSNEGWSDTKFVPNNPELNNRKYEVLMQKLSNL